MENVHENRDILKEAKARGTAKEELGNVLKLHHKD
jgi:hypothetical protein